MEIEKTNKILKKLEDYGFKVVDMNSSSLGSVHIISEEYFNEKISEVFEEIEDGKFETTCIICKKRMEFDEGVGNSENEYKCYSCIKEKKKIDSEMEEIENGNS